MTKLFLIQRILKKKKLFSLMKCFDTMTSSNDNDEKFMVVDAKSRFCGLCNRIAYDIARDPTNRRKKIVCLYESQTNHALYCYDCFQTHCTNPQSSTNESIVLAVYKAALNCGVKNH